MNYQSKSKIKKITLAGCPSPWEKSTREELPFADNTFDIVFHNGGINFFNDKALAISEMLRVAKAGNKLLIADETADFMESLLEKATK